MHDKEGDGYPKYCNMYEGSIDSKEEFEFSECVLTQVHESGNFAQAWSCYEKGQVIMIAGVLEVLANAAHVRFGVGGEDSVSC